MRLTLLKSRVPCSRVEATAALAVYRPRRDWLPPLHPPDWVKPGGLCLMLQRTSVLSNRRMCLLSRTPPRCMSFWVAEVLRI